MQVILSVRGVAPSIIALGMSMLSTTAQAQDIGIQFSEMKVGTKLITKPITGGEATSLGTYEKTIAEEYLGKEGAFHLTSISHLQEDGSWKPVVTVYYDAEGRRVKSERNGKWTTQTPFSCEYVLGPCKHVYVYPNPFTKKDVKKTRVYHNKLEGKTLIMRLARSDNTYLQIPYELGPYNFRVSSKYKNAMDQVRGFELVELVEP